MEHQLPEGQMVFTLQEVTYHLKVTPWTLRRWIANRELQAHKVGGQWRVRRDELLRLLGESSVEAISPADEAENAYLIRHVGRSHMIMLLEMRLLQMALDGQSDEDLRPLLEGLTVRELREYQVVIHRLSMLIESVRAAREDEQHESSKE